MTARDETNCTGVLAKGGRGVGEEFEAAARENMSVCAGSFLV